MFRWLKASSAQVSDAFTDIDITSSVQAPACKHTAGLRLLSSGREVVPALGFAWANCINTRLFLSRTELTITNPCCQAAAATRHAKTVPASLPVRYMRVVFSPNLPQETCLCIVQQSGLVGIDRSSVELAPEQTVHNEAAPGKPAKRSPAAQPLHQVMVQAEQLQSSEPASAASKVPCLLETENTSHPGYNLAVNRSIEGKLATGVFAPSWDWQPCRVGGTQDLGAPLE